jgi:FAD:protein FMN transferase
VLTLPAGMEIDLGGIGKEYAVDKVFNLLAEHCQCALLVNFGGDLRLRGPRSNGRQWQIGFEKIKPEQRAQILSMASGAIATSGDSQRYLIQDGIRYSHILNPVSGWPVQHAPHSVTAIAPTCIEAGIYTSLALMMGADAEAFLDEQQVTYWSIR